jgi:hypothetical protein
MTVTLEWTFPSKLPLVTKMEDGIHKLQEISINGIDWYLFAMPITAEFSRNEYPLLHKTY